MAPVTEFDVSSDGKRCVFVRVGNDPALGDTNGMDDVYVRDLETGTTRLVSGRREGGEMRAGSGSSRTAAISADGRFVVFESLAADLVEPASAVPGVRLYLRDLDWDTMELIGVLSYRRPNIGERLLINTDGSVVVFQNYDRPAGTGTLLTSLRIWSRETHSIEAIQFPADAPVEAVSRVTAISPFLSENGRFLSFVAAPASIWRLDLVTKELLRVSGDFVPAACAAREGASISAEGQMVAFTVRTGISGSLTNQVRVWKAGEGVFTLAQLRSDGGASETEIERWEPWLSPDASVLCFVSADAVPEAGVTERGVLHLYRRELATGVTRVFGKLPGQFPPEIDWPTSRVLWESQEPVLEVGDDNGLSDLLQISLGQTPSPILSLARSGSPSKMAAGNSRTGSGLSDDGRRLAFVSDADDLVARDGGRSPDLFVMERDSRQLRIVSADGVQTPLGQVGDCRMSRQGRHVAISRSGGGWLDGDLKGGSGIYLVDLESGVATLASLAGQPAQPLSNILSSPVLSGDARWIGFQQRGSTVHLYLRDLLRNRTWWLTDPTAGGSTLRTVVPENLQIAAAGGLALFRASGPASWIVFAARDSTEPRMPPLSADDAVLSADGSRVILVRRSNNFSEQNRGVFVQEPFSDSPRRVLSPESSAITGVQCSSDGGVLTYFRRVAPGSDGRLGTWQVWALSVASGTEQLISVTPSGNPGAGNSRDAVLSADGRMIAFRSEAGDLVPGDTNGLADVFVYDRYTGVTSLVSVRPDGGGGNDLSVRPELSGDGRWIAFTSFASNLVPGDSNGLGDVLMAAVPRLPAPDSDGDGLPDGWELDQFGTLGNDGGGDGDGDGFKNSEEFLARTSPVQVASKLSLAVGVTSEGGASLSWVSHTGVSYQILRWRPADEHPSDGWSAEGDVVAGFEGISQRKVNSGLYRVVASSQD